MAFAHNIGIQMNREELATKFMMISNCLHGLYKKYSSFLRAKKWSGSEINHYNVN